MTAEAVTVVGVGWLSGLATVVMAPGRVPAARYRGAGRGQRWESTPIAPLWGALTCTPSVTARASHRKELNDPRRPPANGTPASSAPP